MSEPTQIKVNCSGPQQLERRGLYSPRPPMSESRAQWLQDRLDLLPDMLWVSREELARDVEARAD